MNDIPPARVRLPSAVTSVKYDYQHKDQSCHVTEPPSSAHYARAHMFILVADEWRSDHYVFVFVPNLSATYRVQRLAYGDYTLYGKVQIGVSFESN
jgi:hypothetical protein